MNIRTRIILMVVSTFLLVLSIGAYSILQSRDNAAEVRLVTESIVPSALATADLVSRLKDIQVVTMALVSAPDQNLVAAAQERLKSQKAALQKGLEEQFAQADGAAQRGLVEQTRENLKDYYQAIDETLALKLAGNTALAEANLFANVAQYQAEMEQIIETLRVEKNRDKDEAVEALNRNLRHTLEAISVVTVLAVLILAGIGILLFRQIARPIARMQEGASKNPDPPTLDKITSF